MPHDFTDLFADLDAAKADVARSIKRCRTLVGGHRAPSTADKPQPDKSIFNWPDRSRKE